MSSWQPILGAKVRDLREIELPCLASYKLDGWRAVWQAREFFSRTLKTIPNRNVQRRYVKLGLPDGLDGELISGSPTEPGVFRRTDSVLKTLEKPADDVLLFAFDNANLPHQPFWRRHETIVDVPGHVIKLDHHIIEHYDELEEFEAQAVALGYEGIVTRAPEGRYKYGRSTVGEQFLLKVKRFSDDEGKVIGFEELNHNANPDIKDERGYAHRSSHKEGKIPSGTLGALIIEWRGIEVRVGTGFSSKDRTEIWKLRDNYLGKLAKFKYLEHGMKDLPRHPVWLGWRNDI